MSEKINYFRFYKKAGLTIHNIAKGTKSPLWVIDGKNITSWKDITQDEKTLRMCQMADTKEGYGMFTGEQRDGRFIIGLDFDIYDKDGENNNIPYERDDVRKALRLFKHFEKLPSFTTSTCTNFSIIVDITQNKELVKLIKSHTKQKIQRLSGGGLEILCGTNYVLPPTETECKKCKKIHQKRIFTYFLHGEEQTIRKNDFENVIAYLNPKCEEYLTSIIKNNSCLYKEEREEREEREENEKKDAEYNEKKTIKIEDVEDVEDNEKKTKSKTIDDDIIEIDNGLINELLNALNIKYCDNYDDWIKIGMVIKNLGLSFKLWDNWSRKSKKYQSDSCAKKWETFGNDYKLGLNTLLYYLKNSDYTIYEKIENKLNSSYINFSCLTPEVYTRQLIYILNDNIIFCGNDKQKECYKWNNYYWEILDDEYIEIKKVIKNDLCKHFINLLETKALTSEYIKKNKIKIRNSIKQYLENSRNYDTIINNLKIELYKNDVKFNKNDNIFQFLNACYDLKQDKFIEPERENYINITCGYSYNFKEKYEEQQKYIINFFKSIVDEEYDFLLDYLSTGLHRQNIEQKSLFCFGTGRNGKGKVYDLLKNALGSYFGDIKMEYFTTYEKGPDNPSSNLFECRNLRFIVASEIEEEGQNGKKQKMISSKFKKLTGGDTIQVRQVYGKNQINFPFGQLMFLLNHLPEMPNDVAMRERVMILHFKYNFVSKPTIKTDKLIDKSLGEKFKSNEYRQAFINILFEHYKTSKKGLIIPQSVEDFTKKQFEAMSEVRMWLMNEKTSPIEREIERGSKIAISTLYEIYSQNKNISKTQFGKEINKIEGLNIGTWRGYNYLYGYKLKHIDDNNDDNDDNGNY